MLARAHEGSAVVLTSDRGTFSDYSRSSVLGYFCCLPSRIVPRFMMDHLFAPPSPSDGVEAKTAAYPLRKVEAALLQSGISDVIVVPPERLERAIGFRTRVVGLTVHDPLGMSPVSTKLTMLFGGGRCWNEEFFEELGARIQSIRSRYRFAVVAGGPGVWQLSFGRPPWIDVVFQGEAEADLPPLVRQLMDGGTPLSTVQGHSSALDQIPTIVKPARLGEVQVTRGCPRGCEFCSITPDKFRTIPLEQIEREMAVNFSSGEKNVEFLTDDILLYGSTRLRTNHEAVVRLFRAAKEAGARQIGFAHISAPAVCESPETVREMGRIAEWNDLRGLTPVVGLETGSVRVFRKYMPAKAFPFSPEKWGDVVQDATIIMNEAGIDPCYTLTVGFPDETDPDVDASIRLVQSFLDRDLRAFLFPLPVIPITTSRLRGNLMPELETLPMRYWDLLSLCWKRDLELARRLLPTIVGRMTDPFLRSTMVYFAEHLTPHLERLFDRYAETHGHVANQYRNVRLGGFGGALRSMFWLTQAVSTNADRHDRRLPARAGAPAARTPGGSGIRRGV